MANLSNINNKFIVTDGGNILIGGNISGSSILQVTGTSTFTTSSTVLSLNRTGGATALIELKIGGTVEGYLGATSTKSFVVFNEGAAERFSVSNGGNGTFTGNATIGTGIILESGTLVIKNATGDSSGLKIFQDSSDASKIHNNYNGTLQLGVNNTTTLTLGSSNVATFAGNVGIGITPNTSFSGVDVLQLGKGMTIFGNTDNDRASMCANLYLNASTAFVRVMDGFSGRFAIEDGTMLWGLSGDGNEGDVATVNTKMTLLNNGNLGIGTDSPDAKLEVRHPSYANTNETAIFTNGNSSGRIAYDTLVVSQTDVATLSLVETPGTAAQEQKLTFSVGDNKAVIRTANTSGGMYFNVQASLTAPGYQATSGLTGIHIKNDGDVIMSAGNVGIGTSSPDAKLHVKGGDFSLEQTGGDGNKIFLTTDHAAHYIKANGYWVDVIGNAAEVFRVFGGVGGTTEFMRVTGTGYTKLTDDGDTTWQGYNFHAITQSRASEPTVMIYNDNTGGNNFGVNVIHRSSGSGTTGRFFFGGTSNGSTEKIKIYTNGSIENATNSYGQLSDLKLKENVVDATSKLDDIMKVKIKNFNYIGDDLKQLGVIAQELEEVFPGLVYDTPDSTITNKKEVFTGTSTKGVKYSIFVPMLIKAMQEQQVIIEDFKSRLKILEKN